MKFLYIIGCILFSHLYSSSQNLQFNQVLNYNFSGYVPSASGYQIIQSNNVTVPIGKVWKVESASCRVVLPGGSGIFGSANAMTCAMLINSSPASILHGTSHASIYTPIWLSSGNHTLELLVNNNSGYGGNSSNGAVSIIEFNIVP
jgi:hypothetical protein